MLAAALIAATAASARAATPPPRHPRVAPSAPAVIGMIVRGFVDPSRRNWNNDGPRPLETTIWYPADADQSVDTVTIGPPGHALFRVGVAARNAPIAAIATRHPLVVLSHGTGGAALQLMWLGEALAARGFIVAAVNHHGNTAAEPAYAVQGFTLWWERALDVSRVIDAMLADSTFGPRIDAGRIGAAGFSLGGYTMMEIAGGLTDLTAYTAYCRTTPASTMCTSPPEFPNLDRAAASMANDPVVQASRAGADDSYRDARVRAVLAIAPALGPAFTATGLRRIAIPVAIAVGDADRIAPSAENAARFARDIRGARIETIPGAGHYTFLSECTAAGMTELPQLCADGAGVDRVGMHQRVGELAVAFFSRTLQPK